MLGLHFPKLLLLLASITLQLPASTQSAMKLRILSPELLSLAVLTSWQIATSMQQSYRLQGTREAQPPASNKNFSPIYTPTPFRNHLHDTDLKACIPRKVLCSAIRPSGCAKLGQNNTQLGQKLIGAWSYFPTSLHSRWSTLGASNISRDVMGRH